MTQKCKKAKPEKDWQKGKKEEKKQSRKARDKRWNYVTKQNHVTKKNWEKRVRIKLLAKRQNKIKKRD